MKKWISTFVLILLVMLLTGCGRGSGDEVQAASPSEDAQTAAQSGDAQGRGGFQNYGSAFLTNEYDGALNPMMQLVVGTLQLEETENAVTAEQAGKLLPFWQGIVGGAVTNAQERNAVLKQIETTMTESQMQAIADMQLTFQDMSTWAEANGIEIPQLGGPGGGPGGRGGAFAALTDEQRQELQNLSSPEERRAKLREFGIEIPEGGFGGGGNGGPGAGGNGGQGGGQRGAGGRFGVLMQPVIELLESRANG
ncbi:MAG: hypothetical protein AAF702_36785 [Chloroflexota bacterium]